jgi:hypothetical protein
MSGDMIEGGSFKCFIHQNQDGTAFETASRAEWDKHCIDEKHTIEGTAPCLYCGNNVEFRGMKYQPAGKIVPAICDDCKTEQGIPLTPAAKGGGQ